MYFIACLGLLQLDIELILPEQHSSVSGQRGYVEFGYIQNLRNKLEGK